MFEHRLVADGDGVPTDGIASVANPSRRIPWPPTRWALAGVLVLASMLVTWPAWAESLKLGWSDDECQYILLAPLVIAWLAWVRRQRLPYCKIWGRWLGLPLMIAGAWLWLWGYLHSAATLWFAGPVLAAAGAFISVVGADVPRKLAPAFVALLFLIPLTPTRRHIFAAPMEFYAAQWTKESCRFFGLDVVQHGNLLTVNGTQVEVAEACSGIRQLVSFWLVCYLLAFSRPLKWYARLVILLAVPVVAIASNVARLVPTVWIYSYGAGAAAERFHDAAGWVMLIVAFAGIEISIGLARWLGIPIQAFQRAGM